MASRMNRNSDKFRQNSLLDNNMPVEKTYREEFAEEVLSKELKRGKSNITNRQKINRGRGK